MATVYLAPPTGAMPRMKIEIFNTLLSSEDALGVVFPDDPDWPQSNNLDQFYDPLRCGWLTFTDQDIRIFNFRYMEDSCRIPHGTMEIDANDLWLFGLEIIQRPVAAIYWDGTNTENPIRQPSEPCHLMICIDSEGVVDNVTGVQDEPFGEVWVYGQDENGEMVTEYIDVFQAGVYITAHKFAIVSNCGASFNEGQGSHSTISIWGKCGAAIGRRECRVWIDANGDGIYGLVHAGYVTMGQINACYGYTTVELELFGYGAFLQENDYVSGYKCQWRCKNYTREGESGGCLVNSTHFRENVKGCFIGDQGIYHPNGMQATTYCSEYDPGTEETMEVLPFDGWTYYPDYTWAADEGYEYCPPNYFRAIQAAVNMANSQEGQKPVSRKWSMANKYILTLADDIDGGDENGVSWITVNVTYADFDVNEYTYMILKDEIVHATTISELANGGVDIIITRGAMNTYAGPWFKGDQIQIPYVGIGVGDDVNPANPDNPLCKLGSCPQPDLKASIATTLEKLAKNATVYINNAEYMTWADRFKQIQFLEMNKLNPGIEATGGSAQLTIRPIDIIEEPRLTYSDVVNEVSAKITLTDGTSLTARMRAEDIGVTGYEKSVQLFGRFMQEEDNPFLNSFGPVEGKVDFQTWATNYLKLRAFPVLMEEICVFGFVPDEHYWHDLLDTWEDPNDVRMLPLLERTDITNRTIDLRGVRIEAPDYSKAWDDWVEEGVPPMATWVVQAVSTRFDPPGELKTYLTLRRYTTPEDFS